MNMKKSTAVIAAVMLASTLASSAHAASDLTVPAAEPSTIATPTVPAVPSVPKTPSTPQNSSSGGTSSGTSGSSTNLATSLVNTAGFSSAKQFTGYFANLKRAVANGNRESVAKRISYPLVVNAANGTKRSILNQKQFLNEYTSIMTYNVRRALSNQNVNNVMVSSRGVMIGNGQIWIGAIDNKPGIYAINL
ncbi:hypothetical protein [Paenibacillus sp. Z6-24]